METPEQQARDMLERMGIDDAQSFTAGDVVELANLIADKQAAEQRADQAERDAVRGCERIATQHLANARHVAYRIRNRWPQHFEEE